MADESAMRDQAAAFLAESRAREQEAQAQGKSYAVALQRTRRIPVGAKQSIVHRSLAVVRGGTQDVDYPAA